MALEYIGAFIKSHRSANGMTLQALSDVSGVSRSMISQIESAQKSPTIATLEKLAKAMNIRLGDLVDPVRLTPPIEKITATADNLVSPKNSPFVCHQLLAKRQTSEVDFYKFSLEGFSKTAFASNVAGAQKSLWLEKGRLTIYFPNQTSEVKANEMITFEASMPHRFENKSSQIAKGTFLVMHTKSLVI